MNTEQEHNGLEEQTPTASAVTLGGRIPMRLVGAIGTPPP